MLKNRAREVFFFKRKKQKTLVNLGLSLAIQGALGASACPVPGQRQETELKLYFGRDRAGQTQVSEAEWMLFSNDVLTTIFPDGFTVTDGIGQWRDPANAKITREATKIVDVVVPGAGGFFSKVNFVVRSYEGKFRQKSVGIVTEQVCAGFEFG